MEYSPEYWKFVSNIWDKHLRKTIKQTLKKEYWALLLDTGQPRVVILNDAVIKIIKEEE